MQVVRPPWTTARSAAARWRWRSATIATDLTPAGRGSERGVDPRPGDDDEAQVVRPAAGASGDRVEHPAQQRRAHARAADGHHAQRLPLVVAQPSVPQLVAVAEGGGVEARDVAGEVEVRLGPLPDRRAGPARRLSGTTSSG